MNRNVRLTLIQTALIGLADSIWTGTVLAAFVYIMQRNHNVKNTSVGLVEMAYGLSQLLSAFPVGYIADKKGRSPMILAGGVLGLVATAATAYTVWVSTEEDIEKGKTPDWAMWTLAGCMCLWGITGGIASGPTQALYADSIPQGDRSKWYMYLMWAYLFASTIGPAVTVVLFHVYGNGWTLRELRTVFMVGLGVDVVAQIPSFFFSDQFSLDEGSTPQKPNLDDLRVTEIPSDTRRCIRRHHIPYILFASNVVTALGSGMTVKFFPLFFKNTLNLKPADVQIIYVAVKLVMAGASGVGRLAAKKIGRVDTIVGLSMMSVGCLVALALCYDRMPMVPAIMLFVVRTALMNAPYPLQESILMDTVPKHQRARWKSLESITAFGWCGSAALGGVLADHYGYAFTFLITAGLQFGGTCLILLIRHVVPREVKVDPIFGDEVEPLLSDPGDPPIN